MPSRGALLAVLALVVAAVGGALLVTQPPAGPPAAPWVRVVTGARGGGHYASSELFAGPGGTEPLPVYFLVAGMGDTDLRRARVLVSSEAAESSWTDLLPWAAPNRGPGRWMYEPTGTIHADGDSTWVELERD